MTKTAVITGITSGIGQAIKQRLEKDGWKTVGISRHLSADQDGYETDLSRLDSVEPVATRAGEEHGPIDAFIHVAGVWHDGAEVLAGKKLHEFTTAQISATMNVGVTSAMILSARLQPFMSDGAVMLYISGTFQDGGANWLPYYTSKRALEDFIVGLADDMTTLKVYGVSPSDTATESYKKFYPNLTSSAQSPEIVADTVVDLITNGTSSSGSIVKIAASTVTAGYHQ